MTVGIKEKLSWWDAYGNVKHNREDNFKDATYQNVVYALSALYVSIFYLSSISGVSFSDYASTYIQSDYSSHGLAVSPNKKLPDLDPNFTESTENSSAARSVTMLYRGNEEPPANSKDGDIWIKKD